VSPNSKPKNGVNAAGGVTKLMLGPLILKSTPGFRTTLLRLTIMANTDGGVNATPLTVIGKVVVLPSNVRESIFLYCPICGELPK
jgi:hypothetical protein